MNDQPQVTVSQVKNGYSVAVGDVEDINMDIKPGVYVYAALPDVLAFLARLYGAQEVQHDTED